MLIGTVVKVPLEWILVLEWTLAETCPIFKKDDEFDEFKFRTVSILVLLDKGFERYVQKQLVLYFNPRLSKFFQHIEKATVVSLCIFLLLIED